jgi:transposase
MQTVLDVGADVGKDFIVVASADGSLRPGQIANRRKQLLAWLKTLPAGSRVGMEATGRYHVLLADLAHEAGLTVYVINPKATQHYAQGLNRRGKTDRVDAEVLAEYVAKQHARLHPYVPATAEQRTIDRLLKRRARLVAIRGALRATSEDLGECRAELRDIERSFAALIRKLDARLRTTSQASAPQHDCQQRLRTIVGVGPLVSASLANALTRIPFRNGDAFIAYTGLDPRPRDSGKKVGRRRLSKCGPAEVRRLLYNAAMSAAQTPVWKPSYERYRARGLSSTEAFVILGRKIARVAWSLHHHQSTFDAARLAA